MIDITLQITLEPEKENILRPEVSRRGVSTQELAKGFIETNLLPMEMSCLPPHDEERLLDELVELGRTLPPLPGSETYSRESIYLEHG